MSKVNWANSDADIEANLKWIEDGGLLQQAEKHRGWKCPNPYCFRSWHGEEKGTPGENHISRSGSTDYFCPGSHKYGADGRPLE